MENKCNKTPNSNSKYLDHVYCHPSHPVEGKNYIRANNNNNNAGNGGGGATATNADLLALLKENKQLKAMLLLHLDLIQAQSDQLLAKDKQLNTQSAELEALRSKNAQLEAQMEELQRQRQRQFKRAAVSPPPLAKIQRKEPPANLKLTATALPSTNGNLATAGSGAVRGVRNVIGECNGKLISKIILHRVSLPERSPQSTTASDTTSEADDCGAKAHHDDDDEDDPDEMGGADTTGNTTEDSNDAIALQQRIRRRVTPTLPISRGAKPLRVLRAVSGSVPPTGASLSTIPAAATASNSGGAVINAGAAASTPVQVCVTPPTPSRGKQMPLMLCHAPEMHSDESVSGDSMTETEQRSTTGTSPASVNLSGKAKRLHGDLKHPSTPHRRPHHPHNRAKSRRYAYLSTPQMYCTREWEDDEFLCEYEFIKEEANALHADAPMLEIPKWTEHDLTVSYCIEGTEDLSDEIFHKRHTKLEVDEKRRKKWDVQQIREQRRIEKLKRRHCKDEIQVPAEQQPLLSFYPPAEAIQTICFVNDLPVQAFGEVVPKPNLSADFALPWLEAAAAGTTCNTVATLPRVSHTQLTAQSQQQLLNSTFVFLKKRKRQQSASNSGGRQRHASTTKVAVTQQQQSVSAVNVAGSTTAATTSATTTAATTTTVACITTPIASSSEGAK